MKHGLFSKRDLDGINFDRFGLEMKFSNLKMKFLIHLEEEIALLEKWKHICEDIRERITKLKECRDEIVKTTSQSKEP